MWICHVFIHSLVDGILDCFFFQAVIFNALVNIYVQCLGDMLLYCCSKHPGHQSTVCYHLKDQSECSPKQPHHFILPPAVYKDASISTSSPTLTNTVLIIAHSHSNVSEVLFYHGFDLHFPLDNDIEIYFMFLFVNYIFSEENCLFGSFSHLPPNNTF